MQCKIKKITKYNVEGFDITINVSPEELERLRFTLNSISLMPLVDSPEVVMILDTINKDLGK